MNGVRNGIRNGASNRNPQQQQQAPQRRNPNPSRRPDQPTNDRVLGPDGRMYSRKEAEEMRRKIQALSPEQRRLLLDRLQNRGSGAAPTTGNLGEVRQAKMELKLNDAGKWVPKDEFDAARRAAASKIEASWDARKREEMRRQFDAMSQQEKDAFTTAFPDSYLTKESRARNGPSMADLVTQVADGVIRDQSGQNGNQAHVRSNRSQRRGPKNCAPGTYCGVGGTEAHHYDDGPYENTEYMDSLENPPPEPEEPEEGGGESL